MKKLLTILFTVFALSSFGQSLFNRWIPASGTDTYTTNITSFTTYNNSVVYLKFANTNTTTSTININSIGAQPLRMWDGDSWEVLTASQIDVNTIYKCSYSGSYYEMESFGTGGGGGAWGTITGTLSDQTDLQNELNAKANEALTHNTQTGTTYTLVLTDKDSKLVEMNNGSANTLTVPPNASVAFPTGTQIPVSQYGAGLTTIAAGVGVTINSSSGSLDSPGQYAVMVLEKRGTNEWYLWNGSVGGGTVESVTGDGVDNTDPANPVLTFPVASEVDNTPAGNIAAIEVQAAINELDTEKQGAGLSYLLASGGTASAANTFTANTTGFYLWNGTWTAAANNDFHMNFAGSFTSRNTNSDVLIGYKFAPALATNAGGPTGQHLVGVDIVPTFSGTGSPVNMGLRMNGTNLGFASSSLTPGLVRASTTTGGVIVITNSAGSRSALIGGGQAMMGTITSDDPSTGFGSGMNINVNNLSTTGYVTFGSGTRTDAAGTIVGTHSTMTMSPTSGTANFFAAKLRLAGAPVTSYNGIGTVLFLENAITNQTVAAGYRDLHVASSILQNASSTTPYTAILIAPTYNQTNTATGTLRAIDYNPTETAILGSHYFITNRSTTALSGFATATPLSTVDVDGSVGMDITSTSTDITLNATHCTVLVDASGATRTITLPTAASSSRRIYTIKKTDSSGNAVTVDGDASETIDGATTQSIATQWEYLKIQSNGSAWFIIGND